MKDGAYLEHSGLSRLFGLENCQPHALRGRRYRQRIRKLMFRERVFAAVSQRPSAGFTVPPTFLRAPALADRRKDQKIGAIGATPHRLRGTLCICTDPQDSYGKRLDHRPHRR